MPHQPVQPHAPTTPAAPIGILFICLGNICRSPLAKWVFTDRAQQANLLHRFLIDSCGTGHWHVGGPADRRASATARGHGLPTDHTARQLNPAADFARFHWLIAMDRSNLLNLRRTGAPADRLHLMRSFDPSTPAHERDHLEVPDPYEGTDEDFQSVYRMLIPACDGLLAAALAQADAARPATGSRP